MEPPIPMSSELQSILADLPKTSPRVVIRRLGEYLPSLDEEDRKAQLNAAHPNGHGASMNFAAEYNAPDLARYLKEQGALANTRDKDEDFPLSTAAIFNSLEVGKVLLENKDALNVDLEAVNRAGETALAAAGRKNNKAFIIALLDAGASPNVYDEAGRTPLHDAAMSGDEELIESLLKHGASALALTKKADEMNAGAIARRNNRPASIIKLLDDAVDRQLFIKNLDRPIRAVDFDDEMKRHPEDIAFLTAINDAITSDKKSWLGRIEGMAAAEEIQSAGGAIRNRSR